MVVGVLDEAPGGINGLADVADSYSDGVALLLQGRLLRVEESLLGRFSDKGRIRSPGALR